MKSYEKKKRSLSEPVVHYLKCYDLATGVTQDLDNVFHMLIQNPLLAGSFQSDAKSLKTSSIRGFLGVWGCSTDTTNTHQMFAFEEEGKALKPSLYVETWTSDNLRVVNIATFAAWNHSAAYAYFSLAH